MKNITPLVRRRILRLFGPEEQREVSRLLQEDCGALLPGAQNASVASIKRIQRAVLKSSGGRMDKLYDAISLAQTDWRDLLVASGFVSDPLAHLNWSD